MTPKFQTWIVDADLSGQRLDVFLQKQAPQRSRSEWTKLIEDGCVYVNDKRINKNSQRVQTLDEVTFDLPPVSKNLANVNFLGTKEPEVLFEDEHLLVINKPEGLGVHAGNGMPFEKTLAAWLVQKNHLQKDEEWPEDVVTEERWGIVHRLDMGTSGAMLAAKNPVVHRQLSEMFQKREIHRRYFAVCTGILKEWKQGIPPLLDKWCRDGKAAFRWSGKEFSLATFYGRDPHHPLRMSPLQDGDKRAITHGKIIFEAPPHSLVELKLQTGRTHQIRAHMRFLSWPLVGDELYGGQTWRRLLLHSHRILFEHPVTHENIALSATSATFQEACLQLGLRVPSETDDKF